MILGLIIDVIQFSLLLFLAFVAFRDWNEIEDIRNRLGKKEDKWY